MARGIGWNVYVEQREYPYGCTSATNPETIPKAGFFAHMLLVVRRDLSSISQ